MLHRQNVPLTRDVILMSVPDEEVGGALGAEWMMEPLRRARSRVRDRRRRLRQPRHVRGGQAGFGISVAEKKIVWLKLRAEGVAGHGSQPHDNNPNEHLMRALARLFADADRRRRRSRCVDDDEAADRRPLADEQVQQRDPAVDDLADQPPLRRRRSAEDQRDPVGGGSDARLPRAAGHDGGAVDQAESSGGSPIRRSRSRSSTQADDPVVTPQDTPLYRALEAAIKRRHPDAIVTPMTSRTAPTRNGFRAARREELRHLPGHLPAASILSMHGDAEFIPVDAHRARRSRSCSTPWWRRRRASYWPRTVTAVAGSEDPGR